MAIVADRDYQSLRSLTITYFVLIGVCAFVSSTGLAQISLPGPGYINTVAGNGTAGYSGDGALATRAEIYGPSGLALDSAGNLYFAEFYNQRIRKVTASTGNISTVAGNGTAGYLGDGGVATSAELKNPTGVAVDSAGNIYIADFSNSRIRAVNTQTTAVTILHVVIQPGDIATVAGTGTAGYSGDGAAAISAKIAEPSAVALDSSGNLYIADEGNNRIRKVLTTGTISTVAGGGSGGDGGLATSASLLTPTDVFIAPSGDFFIADLGDNRVRKVTISTGIITTVAGNGTSGYSGDGGPATSAELDSPSGVSVDVNGNLYIVDALERLRVVDRQTQIISTLAGNGTYGETGDGGLATNAELGGPARVALDKTNNIYVSDEGGEHVRAVGASRENLPIAGGVIKTVAGNGTAGFSGDGGAAISAELYFPSGVAVDSADNLYIADYQESRIRKVTASTGFISTVAGNGILGYAGDGGPALNAEFDYVYGVAVDASANIYIADYLNSRVRAVNTGTTAVTIAGVTIQPGNIATIAGTGTAGFSGDGGAATSAKLNGPISVAVDASGNVYIADSLNFRIRKVTASTGHIATIAGNGVDGYSGDNGPATSAELNYPDGVGVDSAFNVYIADTYNARIRMVSSYGVIFTLAGNGHQGYAVNGGAASQAELYYPRAVAADPGGNVYIADEYNNRLRAVDSGLIYTLAGNGTEGYSGDGGPADNAELNIPGGVAVDSSGNVYIADTANHRVRQITTAPDFYPPAGSYTGTQLITISSPISSAVVYYTTNGSTPTTASAIYSAPITVTATETVKAIAVPAGFSTSAVGSATYTISAGTAAATPTFSPAAGSYTGSQNLTISDTTTGATIYYTLNGSTPTTASSVYEGPFGVGTSETVKAIAVAPGDAVSAVGSAAYTITAATPTFSPAAGTYTGAQSVSINDAATPATIYYTTNGSTPTTSSSVYSGAIQVSATGTVKAIAVTPGASTSAVGSAAYTINSSTATATPTFSPAAGTYTGTQKVTISDSTTHSIIYYTTNGTTPTSASSVYSTPIMVDATATVKAIAIATGDSSSAVGSAAYTINAGTKVATPTFTPAAGSYTGSQAVTLKTTTSGATIYYTTNGTTPTTASAAYSAPVVVSATATIKALAVAMGDSDSAVASAAYTISGGSATATPTFSPTPGGYTTSQKVTISDSTSGAAIYYTTNGTTPTTASSRYTAPITVSATETVSAIAIANGSTSSAVGSGLYTILLQAATPTFSPAPGSYDGAQTVTISDTTSGATILYSINGSTPLVYSSPITVSVSETVTAIAVATGKSESAYASGSYVITTCVQ
ncbi:MAG TPA: chitobiase/beta-hexosaminidase C-terminal domain-containing protein [Candidatus Solibacter sp.]|nr:chitobiase/beta-hexosaminidase C-terminal domain-containing protein [Candidatus Solibacter sp.]